MKVYTISLIILLLVSGVHAANTSQAEELFHAGLSAYQDQAYEKAWNLFNQSVVASRLVNNTASAHRAMVMEKQASWMIMEMMLNTSTARQVLSAAFPGFSEGEREELLKPGRSIQMNSDGETRYFIGIANNVMYHNLTLIRNQSCYLNHSPFFDEVYPFITRTWNQSGTYGNPHTYIAHSMVSIPPGFLPGNGTLKVWLPLPVETESQKDISLLSAEPSRYMVSRETEGDLGNIYFEIPLDEVHDYPLNITADYRFTTYERRFRVDPDTIAPYDTGSRLFRRYTSSQPNIQLTPEVSTLAHEIIGDEENPYRKAALIYRYIITTYPYSTVPHTYLAASRTPESSYMLTTGFGDCGTQSMLFAALCRSVGVPARSSGGYQLAPGLSGPHFWAEFYLPEHGWIPVDVTIAEAGDWACNKTGEETDRYKEYYFGSMDPYRYTIQNDVDIPFTPDPGDNIILKMVHQTPALVCEESDIDLELLGSQCWSVSFSETDE